MLCSIQIRDLAVVAALDLDLQSGLSVLTGETGAGKSILLTALGLALGNRADSDMIRPGSNRAEIHLDFDVKDAPSACQWLKQQELTEEDGRCLIRRVIKRDGRSQAFVNDRPVTLNTLQELSSQLIEIHGQHAHIGLLKPAIQQELLDAAAHNQALLAELKLLVRDFRELSQQIDNITENSEGRRAKEEILTYQIAELEQLDINQLDYQSLQEELALLANMGKVLENGQLALQLLDDNEDASANALIAQASQSLEAISEYTQGIEAISVTLNDSQSQLQDAAQELRRLLDAMEADPARLDWLNERLSALQTLARKHHIKPEALPAHLEALQLELDSLTHDEGQLDALKAQKIELEKRYQTMAIKLTERRKKAAVSMQKKISAMIKELGMPHGEFVIEIEPREQSQLSSSGNEHIEFCVSANPGLPPKPLAKVASGGELSRISLAIQVATTQVKTTPTMVFDEVDSGIGGGVAEIVGQRMRALGTDRQVLCVTHLPQVAAQAHHHLLVEKSSDSSVTQSQVRPLEIEQKTQEIARMLGGIELTEQTLAHAAEMLSWAKNQP